MARLRRAIPSSSSTSTMALSLALSLLLLLASGASAKKTSYEEGDPVIVYANKVGPFKNPR